MSPKGSPECGAPLGGLMSAAGPSSAGKKASSAFAPTAKGRFDSGPGSMYGDASKATPPPTFNPNDRDGFGAKAVTSVKPSAGFAPTAKGRFDAGPGSMYASATPAAKKSKKTKPADPMDEKAAEWSKALGLGAVAGAKAAPMLKAVDEARERAEATAAEAIAAKEEAEASAAEAVRKSEWITRRADERVAEAEIEVRTAESALAAERAEHDETRRQLQELAEAMAAKEEEMAEMRRELKHGPKKASPKAAGKAGGQVVDRRPVRLRHQLDNEAEAKAEMLEQRKAKREEHWKRLEEERRAKEERL